MTEMVPVFLPPGQIFLLLYSLSGCSFEINVDVLL